MRSLLALVVVTALASTACSRALQTSAVHPCPPPRSQGASAMGIIGMSLDRRLRAGSEPALIVDRVVPDGPAATAGIRPGDQILQIEGASTAGMSIADAARSLRGPIDASIGLVVATGDRPRDVTITRVAPSELWSSAGSGRTGKKAADGVTPSDLAPAVKISAPPCRR
jgi:membrane-associated protease RseP (regulator of RpoE activity)